MTDQSITAAQLKAQLQPLLARFSCGGGPMIVAVSGGGDSMALALLAGEAYPGRVTAITIDHGLRAESAAEASQVHTWLGARGIPHRTFAWTGPKPQTGIQARARTARYALLAKAAEEIGSPAMPAPIVTAHTIEDQIETIAMRAARGSPSAGMCAASELAGAPPVPLLRPLLTTSRASLRAALHERGQPWIEDPSNEDPRFERVRVRAEIAGKGATWAASLAREAEALREMDRILDAVAEPVWKAAVQIAPEGFATLERTAFFAAPDVVAFRLMSKLLRAVGGGAYPPAGASLEALLHRLRTPEFRGATLAGCRIVPAAGDRLVVTREIRAGGVRVPVRAGETLLWDRRFFVKCPARGGGLTVGPLGPAAARVRADLRQSVTFAAATALPGLWHGQHLVTPLLPNRCAGEPADALFAGMARIENRLTLAWRTWETASAAAPTVS